MSIVGLNEKNQNISELQDKKTKWLTDTQVNFNTLKKSLNEILKNSMDSDKDIL